MKTLQVIHNKIPMMRIGLLAYDGCMGSGMFGIADTLLIAERIFCEITKNTQHVFELHVIGIDKKTVRLAGGTTLQVKKPTGTYDLLIVPGPEIKPREDWDKKLKYLAPELSYIQKVFGKGSMVASVCVGAFLLGEAGLLDGRRVTTAWLIGADLARRYPNCELCVDQILVEDGAVITTGALSATFDLAIHIIKQRLGARIASATARIGLIQNARVSQAPFVDTALIQNDTPHFSRNVQQWLRQRLHEPFQLDAVAQAFNVSTRTLLRRIKVETGFTPLMLLQQARIEKAKKLLVDTQWSIARVVEEIGYSDVSAFSRLFARLVGETPAKYRRR